MMAALLELVGEAQDPDPARRSYCASTLLELDFGRDSYIKHRYK